MGAAPSLDELASRARGGAKAKATDFEVPEQWRLEHVVALRGEFARGNYDFGVDQPTFDFFLAEALPAARGAARELWRRFDTTASGLVNLLEVMSGLAVMCMGSVEAKISLVFELNDFNGQGSLSYDELVLLLYLVGCSTVLASNKGVLPEEHAMEALADEAFVASNIDLATRIHRADLEAWLLEFLGITEETPSVGLREFLKRMQSLKPAKTAGLTAGQAALA
jgi:hypothetical protein